MKLNQLMEAVHTALFEAKVGFKKIQQMALANTDLLVGFECEFRHNEYSEPSFQEKINTGGYVRLFEWRLDTNLVEQLEKFDYKIAKQEYTESRKNEIEEEAYREANAEVRGYYVENLKKMSEQELKDMYYSLFSRASAMGVEDWYFNMEGSIRIPYDDFDEVQEATGGDKNKILEIIADGAIKANPEMDDIWEAIVDLAIGYLTDHGSRKDRVAYIENKYFGKQEEVEARMQEIIAERMANVDHKEIDRWLSWMGEGDRKHLLMKMGYNHDDYGRWVGDGDEFEVVSHHEYEAHVALHSEPSNMEKVVMEFYEETQYFLHKQRYHEGEYQGKKKDINKWYLEPDASSIHTFEIISPAMRLQEALSAMKKTFDYIAKKGHTTNTEGLHVTMSVDGKEYEDFNLAKLALFMGSGDILAQFERQANKFAVNRMDEVKEFVRLQQLPSKVLMRDFEQIAEFNKEQLEKMMTAGGKYSAINVSKLEELGLIEFRMMGNTDYHLKFDEVSLNVLRYAQVMTLATSNAMNEEYQVLVKRLLNNAVPALGGKPRGSVSVLLGKMRKSPFFKQFLTNGSMQFNGVYRWLDSSVMDVTINVDQRNVFNMPFQHQIILSPANPKVDPRPQNKDDNEAIQYWQSAISRNSNIMLPLMTFLFLTWSHMDAKYEDKKLIEKFWGMLHKDWYGTEPSIIQVQRHIWQLIGDDKIDKDAMADAYGDFYQAMQNADIFSNW